MPDRASNHAIAKRTNKDANVVDLRGANTSQIEAITSKYNAALSEKAFLENLLQIEAAIRSTKTLQELKYFVANELRSTIVCDQILILKPKLSTGQYFIDTVSNLVEPDKNSPMLQWLSKQLNDQVELLESDQAGALAKSFRLKAESAPQSNLANSSGLMVRLIGQKNKLGAIVVFLSEKPFSKTDFHLAERLSKTISYSWQTFERRNIGRSLTMPRPVKLLLCAALLLVAFIPVPLTVLAPAQIVADDPKLVTAPLNGVIERIAVKPNSKVKKGDILFSYEKTDATNLVDQTDKQFAIADAKFRKANQDAFGAGSGRKDMAVAKAELDLAIAEKKAALRKQSLTDVSAQVAGIILFDSADKWLGKPVVVGERVMKIANPEEIKFKLDLPTQEAIILSQLKTARVFLDSDPLNPVKVSIESASYEAKLSDANVLVFPIFARQVSGDAKTDLRIGLRGTAQVSGDYVPLWFFLLRKPLSFLRQFTGL